MLRRVALVSCLLGGLACASPSVAPLSAGPITPGPGERVAVTHSYLVVDSSESVQHDFASDRRSCSRSSAPSRMATTRPRPRLRWLQAQPRRSLRSIAASRRRPPRPAAPREGTPLDRCSTRSVRTSRARAARPGIVFSDGHRPIRSAASSTSRGWLDAAAGLASSYQGQVCIHTVTPRRRRGCRVLRKLSPPRLRQARTAAACRRRRAPELRARGLPRLRSRRRGRRAARLGRRRRDDDVDQCGTPAGVKVDERGCWVSATCASPSTATRSSPSTTTS